MLKLKSDDPAVRSSAAKQLKELYWQPKSDVERALRAVANQCWQEAAALGPAAVEPLLVAMKNYNYGRLDERYKRSEHVALILACGQLADDRMVSALRVALHGPEEVGKAAATALAQLATPAAIELLIAELHHGSTIGIQERAAEALGRINDNRVVVPLVVAMGSLYDSLRRKAADALKARAWEPAGVNEAAEYAIALGDWSTATNLGPSAIAALLASRCKRKEVIDAVVRMGDAAVEALAGALRDPSTSDAAARALRLIGTKSSVEALVRALEDRDFVRLNAALSLAALGDQRAVGALVAALAGPRRYDGMPNLATPREEAAFALQLLGDPRAVWPLAQLATSDTDAAPTAVHQLELLLERTAASASQEDLQKVASLDFVRWRKCNPTDSGFPGQEVYYTDEFVDCSRVKDIALTELQRRGPLSR